MTTTTTSAVPAGKFLSFDHIHFWVGNAKQAADWYVARFGFKKVAYRGLETGVKDMVTHVVKQNKCFLAFSSSLKPGNKEMGEHQEKHGDGAKDVAFTVDDAVAIFNTAVANGATAVQEPTKITSETDGTIILASVKTYGDTIHTFVERKNYTGLFLPGYAAVTKDDPLENITPPVGLEFIDHVVGNQNWGEMEPVCQWYEKKLGFHRFWSVDDKQIYTEFSALKSVVMTDKDENIKMPINEPAKGKKKSQIEEYVEYYGGSGVQHIALATADILTSVKRLRERGIEFLQAPQSYYTNLRKRLQHATIKITEEMDLIEKHGILVDFDDEGYLLQIFTKPVEDRPTLFYEIIQRHNNNGFGAGNFKALFEAIEQEQAKRGTLTDTPAEFTPKTQ